MKRFALLTAALSLFLYSAYTAQAQNRFRVGGARPTQGTVRFQLNGGANRPPQFRIGGNTGNRLNRINARRVAVANSFPVAVGGYGYGGNCCYFGQGGFSNLYNQSFIPVPPYFSLHPPVYYSVPVPRTYGYSPFAYPGSVPTPDVVLSDPETIINPHVQPEEVPEPAQETSSQTASAPLVIRNPFIEQASPVTLTAQK